VTHAYVSKKPSLMKSFSLSQLASAVATAVDFGLVFGMTELLGVWYVISVAVGAGAGAITNFLMNRHWSFAASHQDWRAQAGRYALVSTGSLLLNTAGTWAITEWFGVPYAISVIGVSLVVGFAYNYPLQRHYVFR
jgi:putative flippase GtrA